MAQVQLCLAKLSLAILQENKKPKPDEAKLQEYKSMFTAVQVAGHRKGPSFLDEGDTGLFSRILRVCLQDESQGLRCVGTCACIEKNVVVTCHHVVFRKAVDKAGDPLMNAQGEVQYIHLPVKASGCPLQLDAADAGLDLAILSAPGHILCQDPFSLAPSSEITLYRKVTMLSFPEWRDEEYCAQGRREGTLTEAEASVATKFNPRSPPYPAEGRITIPNEDDALIGASYPGWPNSSGGAVITNSRSLVGIHLSSAFHEHRPPALTKEQADALEYNKTTKAGLGHQLEAVVSGLATTNLNAAEKASASLFVPVACIQTLRYQGRSSPPRRCAATRKRSYDQLAAIADKRQTARRVGAKSRAKSPKPRRGWCLPCL